VIGSRAAHQVHGAIRLTDDYPLSSLTRACGACATIRRREQLGPQLLDEVVRGGPGTVWEALSDR